MSDKEELFAGLLVDVERILGGPEGPEEKLRAVTILLRERVDRYDWVGFYLVDGPKRELVLGPYSGEPTEHVRIPFGRGVCGQAAERERTLVVQDVAGEENYLSCSPSVQSEIVVPLFRGDRLVGELDVDSHTPAAFSEEDQTFLARVGETAAGLLG